MTPMMTRADPGSVDRVMDRLRGRIRGDLLGRWMPATTMARQLGPLTGCHNEWSVISDAFDSQQQASAELVEIAIDAIGRAARLPEQFVPGREMDREMRTWPGEHYRLLPALCEAAGVRRVVEIGTWKGQSALAFLTASTVERVDTFDVVAWDQIEGTMLRAGDFGDRLTQHLDDLADPTAFARHRGLVEAADLIFADGPKDGVFESSFFAQIYAAEPAARQLILLDDTRLMTMVELWRELPAPKLDLTSFGHWSGTGLLMR